MKITPRIQHKAGPLNILQEDDKSTSLRIAIIGGGLSGLATAYELFDNLDHLRVDGRAIEITIFDPRGFDGRGIPYSPPNGKSPKMISAWKKLTLNVTVKNMFANLDKKIQQDFWSWLNSHSQTADKYTEASFIPRVVFGDFLEHLSKKVTRQLKTTPGVTFQVIQKKISHPIAYGQKLALSYDGQQFEFDKVFGAFGHFRSLKLEQLEGETGYFRTPYNFNLDKMQTADTTDPNLLLWGGESSLIDAITIAEEMGYKGNYTLVTRAAESMTLKRTTDAKGTVVVPETYEKFIQLRDHKDRVKIIYGFVHEAEIQKDPTTNAFNVPITRLEFSEANKTTLTAANLVNAALWEITPNHKAGYEFSHIDFKVHSIKTDQPCTDFVSELQEEQLIKYDRGGMMHTNHPALEIVGSPLMVGREDMSVKRWSADHSWQTAWVAVQRLCASLHVARAPLSLFLQLAP